MSTEMTIEQRCAQSLDAALKRGVTDCIPIRSMHEAYHQGLAGKSNSYDPGEPECTAYLLGYGALCVERNEKARRVA